MSKQHIIANIEIRETTDQALCVFEFDNNILSKPSRVIVVSQFDEVDDKIIEDFTEFPKLANQDNLCDNFDNHERNISLMNEHYLKELNEEVQRINVSIFRITQTLREKYDHTDLCYEDILPEHIITFLENEFHVQFAHEEKLRNNVLDGHLFAEVFLQNYLDERKEKLGF